MLGCPKGTLGVLATGAAVPAAKIFLTNIATHATCETVSTDSGDYAFPAVAPGGYNLRVEHSSFKAAGSRNVQAQVQQTVRLDFTLLVGQVTESVEVSASAQMLQSENLSSGSGQAGSRQGGDRAAQSISAGGLFSRASRGLDCLPPQTIRTSGWLQARLGACASSS